MSFPVPIEYDMPDVKYNDGNVVTLPPSLSGDGTGVNLSQLEKDLILTLFSKAAYAENDAGTAYETLENLWTAPTKDVESITAVYTQSGTVYDTDTLDSLKNDLIVTANYYDGTSETVIGYTLSGTLTVGTSTITVSYAGLTDTFDVNVTHEEEILHQLSARNVTLNSTNNVAVQDVDRITHTTGSNSQVAYIKSNGTAQANITPISQWFGLSSGDSYVYRIKNIVFSDNNNTDNYFAVALKNDSSTSIVTSGNIAIEQIGSGTISDVEITGTMTENVTNVTLFSFVYRAMVISYDVELYVNGVRYV